MKLRHLVLLLAALCGSACAADPARQPAPSDGWAGQAGGTRGGADASADHVYTVSNRSALLAALARAGEASKIVRVDGLIDMTDGRAYASSADQGLRGMVHLTSNTTLIGVGEQSGFINANLMVSGASQVIIRNLAIRNPCDVGPVWDPNDAPRGNWNSLFDGVTVTGSHHIWIDHNSFTDAPDTDERHPIENGMRKQCHDGAVDITKASDYITLSYNRFADHDKNTLIGSSDKALADDGHLKVTVMRNLFENVEERSPRVRFGQVHVVNNYYVGDRARASYPHQYSIGAGKQARIISDNNVFDVAGARTCADVVRTPAFNSPTGAFIDTGSLLNGAALTGCTLPIDVKWSVPYAFEALPATAVKQHVLAYAGAGKMGAAVDTPVRTMGSAPGADYFVETRVRPGAAPLVHMGQVYVVGRYQDADNWYGGGIDLAGGKGKLKLDLVRMHQGVLTRLKQVTRNVPLDGRAHTVRLDLAGSTLTLYLNGERVTTGVDTALSGAGQYGLYNSDNAASVDAVKRGDVTLAPARIALARASNALLMQAGDAPRRLAVSALAGDGVTALAFRAASSNPTVLGVSVENGALMVTPKAAGTSTITVNWLDDPAVETVVTAQVQAPFVVPSSGHAARAVLPTPGARDVPVDTLLRMTFDSPPQLGDSDAVRIYRSGDGALVDTVRTGDDDDVLGYPGQLQARVVRQHAIHVNGNSVIIKPHNGVLAYDTDYHIETGIGKAPRWHFRTRATAPTATTLTVDDDGKADFATVQGALNHVMQHVAKKVPARINVRNGDYEELLFIRDKDRLTIKGESRDGVRIHYTNNEAFNPGSGVSQPAASPGATGGRALLLIEASDLVTLDTLTLTNTTLRGKVASGQAETLHFNDESGHLIAKNASFFSEQDTIQLKGYAWFYRTLIAGNVDFIWGANRAALIEESEVRSVGDSGNAASGGYVVQARTINANDKGFVFLRSRLTHGAGPAGNDVPAASTYLARSPGTAATWDQVTYIDCVMDAHVAPRGWAGAGVGREPAPNPAVASAAQGWREFGSRDARGKLIDLSQRVGGHILSAEEVREQFGDRATILAGWNPAP